MGLLDAPTQYGGLFDQGLDPATLQGLLAQNDVAKGALGAAMQPNPGPASTSAQPPQMQGPSGPPPSAPMLPAQGAGQQPAAPAGAQPFQPQEPSFLDYALGVLGGKLPQSVRADSMGNQYAIAQKQLEMQVAMANMANMRRAASMIGGDQQTPSAAPPAAGSPAPSQAGPPSFQAPPMLLAPSQGAGAGGALPPGPPGGSPGPTAGGPPPNAPTLYTANMRRALSLYALSSGHADQAAAILADKLKQGNNGYLFDEQSGAVRGRLPDQQYQNGFRVDPGAPDAPSFVPTLAGGTMPDGKGGVVPIPGAIAAAGAASAADANAKEAAAAKYAGPKAFGTAAAGAQFQFVDIPQADGSTKKVWLPAAAGAAGSGGGLVGQTPTPAASTFSGDQGKAASDFVNTTTGAREGAISARQNALTAKQYAISHPMNAGTPLAVSAAGYLRTLPPEVLSAAGVDPAKIDKTANDAGIFNRVTNTRVLQMGKSLLPSRYTERELMLTKPIAGSLSTPNDAASYGAAMDASLAKRIQDQADFAASYAQDPRFRANPSRANLEQAWANSPGANRSIYQDPEAWGGVKLNGKPAVQYVNVGGKTVGVFGYGTPFQHKFAVQP